MILDTSAVVAIVMKEPGHEGLLQAMASDGNTAIGAATRTDAAIVLSARLQGDARSLLARFLSEASIAVVPFGESHYGAACPRTSPLRGRRFYQDRRRARLIRQCDRLRRNAAAMCRLLFSPPP